MKKLTALLLMGIALHQTQTMTDANNIVMSEGNFTSWQSADSVMETQGLPTMTDQIEDQTAQRTDKLQLHSADYGQPNVGYIQSGKVYNSDGTLLGTYESSLRKTTETQSTWSRLPMYVELVQNNGAGNAGTIAGEVLTFGVGAIAATIASAVNGDGPEGYTGAFTTAEKPDNIYFPVYISDQTTEGIKSALTVTS